MRRVILIALMTLSASLSADQITLPHTFMAGAKAKASEVNDNFTALLSNANSIDNRLNTIETASTQTNSRLTALEGVTIQPVSDQLVCVVFYSWPIDGSAYSCVQASNPASIRSMTYAQVAAEKWIAVSIGGDGNNRVTYIFSK